MIGKTGSGWQTTTADLALILFLVVSASAVDRDAVQGKELAGAIAPSLEPSPSVAVYRATPSTTLPQWLQAQPADERQIATVLVTRAGAGGGATPALAQALAFLDQIEASGRTGRLLVERGSADEVSVVLAYDRGSGSGTALAKH